MFNSKNYQVIFNIQNRIIINWRNLKKFSGQKTNIRLKITQTVSCFFVKKISSATAIFPPTMYLFKKAVFLAVIINSFNSAISQYCHMLGKIYRGWLNFRFNESEYPLDLGSNLLRENRWQTDRWIQKYVMSL